MFVFGASKQHQLHILQSRPTHRSVSLWEKQNYTNMSSSPMCLSNQQLRPFGKGTFNTFLPCTRNGVQRNDDVKMSHGTGEARSKSWPAVPLPCSAFHSFSAAHQRIVRSSSREALKHPRNHVKISHGTIRQELFTTRFTQELKLNKAAKQVCTQYK